tara:strand:- start:115 stop:336 length:222 start_codon:yes stop_codon:yes gene_type:complete
MINLESVLKYLVAGMIISAISFSLIEWQKRQPGCPNKLKEYNAGISEHVTTIVLWPIILSILITILVRDMISK